MADGTLSDLSRAGLDLAKVVGVAGAIGLGAWFTSATVARVAVLETNNAALAAKVETLGAEQGRLASDVRSTRDRTDDILKKLDALDAKLDDRTIYASGRR